MSKEQIEEMKNDLFRGVVWKDLGDGAVALDIDNMTENLYNAGDRKQSEAEWSHGVNDTVKCSICRRRMPKIYCMNFCPNCGAKMKGGAG